LLRGTFRQNLAEGFECAQRLDLGNGADVFANELLMAQRAPAATEARIATQERLRKAAMIPKGIPIFMPIGRGA